MARLSEADLPLFKEKRVNDPEKALKLLRVEARGCTRCDLYKNATQTVFGEGPADASLMLIGEQPGDQEDLAGLPFVGPAGQLFDRALEEAGIDRARVYVTNAVKHFKFEPRGKRRIHKKPSNNEIEACRWWLDNELDLVQPAVAVAMGATAARGLMRKAMSINANRGRLIPLSDATQAVITVHPSYLLRLQDVSDKKRGIQLVGQRLAYSPRRRKTELVTLV